MKYAEVENRAIYEERANSVGTGLDKLHGGRTKFALFLKLLSVGNMWRTNTPGWKVRTFTPLSSVTSCVYVCE